MSRRRKPRKRPKRHNREVHTQAQPSAPIAAAAVPAEVRERHDQLTADQRDQLALVRLWTNERNKADDLKHAMFSFAPSDCESACRTALARVAELEEQLDALRLEWPQLKDAR